MKKLYTIIALCALSLSAFSQGRSVDLAVDDILSPESIKSGVAIQVKAVLKNGGPDDLKMGDTLLYRAVLVNTPTQWLGVTVPRVLRMGDTIHVNMVINGYTFTGNVNNNFCIQAIGANRSADSLKVEATTGANNSLCETVWYSDGTSSVFSLTGQLSDATVYPNPATTEATIRFTNPEAAEVSVEIMDISGKVVKTMAAEHMDVGEQELEIDCTDMESGIYFYKLSSGKFTVTKKFTVQ